MNVNFDKREKLVVRPTCFIGNLPLEHMPTNSINTYNSASEARFRA